MLLIVDPQHDFISGSLPVAGAPAAMSRLTQWLESHSNAYRVAIATADWHPFHHCSFIEDGGEWPRHCVAFSRGASIDDALLTAMHNAASAVEVLTKGTDPVHEEYSIFGNDASSERIKRIVADFGIERIEICGLAGDVCVKATASDALEIFGREKIRVREEFTASLDGGTALRSFILNNLIN